MLVEPFDWNVVILGHWNRAILTPGGIARRLLKVPENTPIKVEVPIDAPVPLYRVKHNDVTVVVVPGRLEVGADKPDYETLGTAMEVARRALVDLPETPVSAAGFNLRFRFEEAPTSLLAALDCRFDQVLSEAGYDVMARHTVRSLRFEGGAINLDLQQDEQGSYVLNLNFHRSSNKREDHQDWLSTPTDRLRKETEKLLGALPDVLVRSPCYAGNGPTATPG